MYNFKTKTQSVDDIKVLSDAMGVWSQTHYDNKQAGDYSATTLINPPRIVQLKKRHSDDLELPLASQVDSFIGDGVHALYENLLSTKKEYELEKRLTFNLFDRLITGKFDVLLDSTHVYDIKTTKAWKLIFDPDLKEWHEQQNIYAWLLRLNGYHVSSINIVAHYKDWSKGMALRDRAYPKESVVEYGLELWDEKTINEYIESRLQLHIANEEVPDNDLPECSREDRWERFPDGCQVKYALLKTRTAKRATRVLNSLEEAISYGKGAKGFGLDSVIEVRYAVRKRCEEFCDVAKHCNIYQEYAESKEKGEMNDYIPLYE